MEKSGAEEEEVNMNAEKIDHLSRKTTKSGKES